jgi:hypothetical protein
MQTGKIHCQLLLSSDCNYTHKTEEVWSQLRRMFQCSTEPMGNLALYIVDIENQKLQQTDPSRSRCLKIESCQGTQKIQRVGGIVLEGTPDMSQLYDEHFYPIPLGWSNFQANKQSVPWIDSIITPITTSLTTSKVVRHVI